MVRPGQFVIRGQYRLSVYDPMWPLVTGNGQWVTEWLDRQGSVWNQKWSMSNQGWSGSDSTDGGFIMDGTN